jgi:hypothetical protein
MPYPLKFGRNSGRCLYFFSCVRGGRNAEIENEGLGLQLSPPHLIPSAANRILCTACTTLCTPLENAYKNARLIEELTACSAETVHDLKLLAVLLH